MTYSSDTGKKGILIDGASQSISIFKVRVEDTPWGIFTADTHQYYIQILDCILYHNKRSIFPMLDWYITIKSTKVYHSFGWSGIDFNSGNVHAVVENCYFYDCDVGSVKIYSGSGNVTVKNCVIERSSRYGGIYIFGSDNKGPSKVLNCIIKNGYKGSNGILINGIYGNKGTIIKNNIIYNNEGCGIKTEDERYNYLETWYIESNVIYGNGEGGICNPALENKNITVKNNIIANNNGYGLTNSISSSKIISSYNNIYNNSLGRYNGTVTNKTGDISVNPLFADLDNGDFHLKSQYGRWNGSGWVNDEVTSECIDAGDPEDDYSNEFDYPHGKINLGAYGNTGEASLGSYLAAGTLSGKVTDKDTGSGIEGAVVSTNGYSDTTDDSGNYLMTLPIGNYTVTASKTGYYPNSTTAQILENQTTNVDFQLTKDTTPIIIDVRNATPMATTVWILWNVSIQANNTVEYANNSDLNNSLFSSWDSNTSTPKIKLWSLQPNTTYYYRVYSYNPDNSSIYSNSSIYNFTTQECVSYKFVNATDASITGIDHPIQEALDMICLDGGTIELNNGTFNISTPIRIRESNTTLTGQEMDKTIINQITEQESAILIGKFDDIGARNQWLYENNIKLSALLNWFKDHPEEIIQNVRVQKMTVNTKDAPGSWAGFGGISAVEAINLCISEIKGTANPQSQSRNDDGKGISVGHSIDVTVKDCILSGYGYALGAFLSCHRVKVINNTISNIKGWNSIEYNGVWPLRADWKPEDGYTPGDFDSKHPGSLVKGNKIFNGGQCIYVYSS